MKIQVQRANLGPQSAQIIKSLNIPQDTEVYLSNQNLRLDYPPSSENFIDDASQKRLQPSLNNCGEDSKSKSMIIEDPSELKAMANQKKNHCE